MALGFLALYPALRIGFLGDFAGDLSVSQTGLYNFSAYQWNFYIPALLIYAGLYKMFHLQPLPYQVFHLALICCNAWLLYLLAKELKFAAWQCWAAGLLALFNSSAFEAYFWLSTIPKTLAVGYGLIALIFLNRLRQRHAAMWGWGYLVMIVLGITVESTGLILPLLGLCLDLYYRPWREPQTAQPVPFAGLRLHFWSFSLTGIFVLVRHVLGIRLYVIHLTLYQQYTTLRRTILNTFFHGLAERPLFVVRDFYPALALILPIILLTVLLLGFYFKRGNDRRRFLVLLLLWLGACLPHTLGANFESRYLYFSGVMAALVLVDLLGTLRPRLPGRRAAGVFICLVMAGYLSLDLYAFQLYIGSFLQATRIYDAGIQKIESYLPKLAPGTHVVLIDFPDSIMRPRRARLGHHDQYRVLVYRCALPAQLILLDPKFNFPFTLLKLYVHGGDDNPDPVGTLATPRQVAKLLASPRTLAFRYLPDRADKFVAYQGGPNFNLSILEAK